jgi:hypothetical protein
MPVTFVDCGHRNMPKVYYNGIIKSILSQTEVEVIYGDGETIPADLSMLNAHKKDVI